MKKAVLVVDKEVRLRTDYSMVLKKGREVQILNDNLVDNKCLVELKIVEGVEIRFEIYKKQLDIHYDL